MEGRVCKISSEFGWKKAHGSLKLPAAMAETGVNEGIRTALPKQVNFCTDITPQT
jgi:hypothetical protein